ncbi:hypothetical protein BWI96_06830 [Siphonobacter sp. SORGH_AS_0500]|uniref:hypothetical protein n=1 Tax=Siphonobacter sp. SORGH_AS_0500 TaxID=1864824 RepID=UPI000CB2DF76|nr:hypothetical protein [Siphonobacter sp. SORGH_AS_0500]PKK37566.1 hypothetical protein BWI96_06830 [Siphonobacter sp. SORGH_AS_0500]
MAADWTGLLPWLVKTPAIHSLMVGKDSNQGGLLPIPQTHSNQALPVETQLHCVWVQAVFVTPALAGVLTSH